MTRLLAKAIARVAELSEDDQNQLAAWILEELESERRWSRAFEGSHLETSPRGIAEDEDDREADRSREARAGRAVRHHAATQGGVSFWTRMTEFGEWLKVNG